MWFRSCNLLNWLDNIGTKINAIFLFRCVVFINSGTRDIFFLPLSFLLLWIVLFTGECVLWSSTLRLSQPYVVAVTSHRRVLLCSSPELAIKWDIFLDLLASFIMIHYAMWRDAARIAVVSAMRLIHYDGAPLIMHSLWSPPPPPLPKHSSPSTLQ